MVNKMSGHATSGGPADTGGRKLRSAITATTLDGMPKVNLEGLNEHQVMEVLDKYEDWVQARIDDYLSGAITDEITDDQAEAIEYLLDK